MYSNKDIDRILEASSVITVRILADITGLSEKDVDILRLMYKENLSVEEVADRMAMSISSLYRNRSRIKQKIRLGLDLWGIKAASDFSISLDNVFTRSNMFCLAQAELVRYFYRNREDENAQFTMLQTIRKMCGNTDDYYGRKLGIE